MRVFLSVMLAGAFCLVSATHSVALEALEDSELDRVTAAGDPVVLSANGGESGDVIYDDFSEFELEFSVPEAQHNIRALTLQNVVGELQLLTNINILSAKKNVAGTDQRNFSAQSWGSTLPDADTIKTVSAVAPGPCSGGRVVLRG